MINVPGKSLNVMQSHHADHRWRLCPELSLCQYYKIEREKFRTTPMRRTLIKNRITKGFYSVPSCIQVSFQGGLQEMSRGYRFSIKGLEYSVFLILAEGDNYFPENDLCTLSSCIHRSRISISSQ